jgi:hypothetical protein
LEAYATNYWKPVKSRLPNIQLGKKIQTLSSLDCTFVIVCERSLEQRESK